MSDMKDSEKVERTSSPNRDVLRVEDLITESYNKNMAILLGLRRLLGDVAYLGY